MRSFVFVLVWAVVGVAWAWSSSEVSCASCGSECQAACGTRNFRACCFNFQRRRRSSAVLLSPRSWSADDLTALSGPLANSPSAPGMAPPVPQLFLSMPPQPVPRLPRHPSYLQESSEEEEEEEEEKDGGGEDAVTRTGRARERETSKALSRLVALLTLHAPDLLSGNHLLPVHQQQQHHLRK